ncbi:MAG: hypothetical protein A3F78_05935 [Burkholderiales bacterium RIFCSPLOWO2_12_FULL_61_40]|nr:MAG: hypothetical protein A3F78_05935 [Burkholderiales bacterium RIFCSPLOWO2_12_FULL_61_40]
MKQQLKFKLVGVALLAASGAASASCDSVLSSYQFYVDNNLPTNAEQTVSNHPECFGGSTTTSQTQINGTTVQHISAISSALASRFGSSSPNRQAMAGTKSMAAGGEKEQWNVWGSVSNNDTRQNYTSTSNNDVTNNNVILTTVLGGDYVLSPQMVVGVSVAFDSGSGSGLTAGAAASNSLASKGYAIAPYFGMQISQELSLDASLGFGKGEVSMSSALAGSQSVLAESDRRFAAANVSYNQWMDRVQWTGKLGLLHAEEDYANSKVAGVAAAGTAAKNTLDQLRMGAQAGYWMDGAMPYAGLAYAADLNRTTTQFGAGNDPIGKNAWVWSLGVNFFSLKSGVTGGLVYSQEAGRSSQKNNSLLANVNIRF